MRVKKLFVVLALIFMIPFAFVGCGNKDNDDTTPDTEGAPKASVVDVINKVADKLTETNKTLADTANQTTDSSALGANLNGFSQVTIVDDYLWLQEMACQIIYSIEYVCNNATIDNGYAKGFELEKVYYGVAEIDGYEGALTLVLNQYDDGIGFKADFVTEESGYEVNFMYTGMITFDYSTNEVKRVQMNHIIAPVAAQIMAVDINYVENSFTGFQAYDYTYGLTPEIAEDIVEDYNDGSATLDSMLSLPWTHIVMMSGNISSNINNVNIQGYEYSSHDSSSSVNEILVETIFRGVYSTVKELPMREMTDTIDNTDGELVNFIQDAVTYGWNKAKLGVFRVEGKEYYSFSFAEYDEMLGYLQQAKAQIDANSNSAQIVKDTINSAIGYIQNRGKDIYTGQLGYYDGITTIMDTTIWFNSTDKIYESRVIYNSNAKVAIEIITKNGEVLSITPSVLTYKVVYERLSETSVLEEYKEWFSDFVEGFNIDSDSVADPYGYTFKLADGRMRITKNSYPNYYVTFYPNNGILSWGYGMIDN